MNAAAIRQKKCRGCGEWYRPWNTMQQACSPPCALRVGKMAEEKKRKRELREAKDRIKTRGDWLLEAQTAFNRFIKERDRDEPCISCDATGAREGLKKNGWDAGHYRTVGACPELRFEEKNVHKQCVTCNKYRSGNIVEYRIRLRDRIGDASLEWLEGPHEPKRYTIDEIKEIRDLYRWKLRELRKADG